jgi:hypothetical protein
MYCQLQVYEVDLEWSHFIYIQVDTNTNIYNIGILSIQTPMNRYIHVMHETS